MTLALKLLIIPIIAGAIGWITNKIAVWLLFHPKEPVTFLGITFQGVFPKRQNQIADRIGDLVADELLSVESLKTQVFTNENMDSVRVFVLRKVDDYLENEFKDQNPLMSLFIGRNTKEKIKSELVRKMNESMEDLSENFHDYLEDKVNIRKLVSERIRSLDSEEVNQLMNSILKSELGFIEWTGAILGFIIGLIQVLLLEILA